MDILGVTRVGSSDRKTKGRQKLALPIRKKNPEKYKVYIGEIIHEKAGVPPIMGCAYIYL